MIVPIGLVSETCVPPESVLVTVAVIVVVLSEFVSPMSTTNNSSEQYTIDAPATAGANTILTNPASDPKRTPATSIRFPVPD